MKLVNSNIEGDKHFDRVIPFLEQEKPDVICLQEVFRKDLHLFESLGFTMVFLPMTKKTVDESPEELGIALGYASSRAILENTDTCYYHDRAETIRFFDRDQKDQTVNNGIIMGRFTVHNESFTVATTHFTWTPNGSEPHQFQKDDMARLRAYLSECEPHCLIGDFNIPRRHNPLYDELVREYTDEIPASYTSSLDANIHRLGQDSSKRHLFTDYMVDYLFTQPPYVAHDVHLEFGISDHAAIVATIYRG